MRISFCLFITFITTLIILTSCDSNDDVSIDNPYLVGIPQIYIFTEKASKIESKTEYVNCSISIRNSTDSIDEADGKIRGRGNATWRMYPKKPYKIKFIQKESLFGFPSNKDWVLLADILDRSMLRTPAMCELSNAIGMDYTVNYKAVDLFLNGEYEGLYYLTDQVERSENRINVEDDGFIIEDDAYFSSEPAYFSTDLLNLHYTFKYPEYEDDTFNEKLDYIKTYMDKLECVLFKLVSDSTNIDYSEIIDVDSFAKWYLVNELMSNYDPNRYYVLYNKNSKLKMFPLWDPEWSFGLWPVGQWADQPTSMVENAIWKERLYFPYLVRSPLFIRSLKCNWRELREYIPLVKDKLRKHSEEIRLSQEKNLTIWGGQYRNVNIWKDSWDKEVEYIFDFLERREEWLDWHINSL